MNSEERQEGVVRGLPNVRIALHPNWGLDVVVTKPVRWDDGHASTLLSGFAGCFGVSKQSQCQIVKVSTRGVLVLTSVDVILHLSECEWWS